MAKFCLTKETIVRFKKGLKDREIDPFKLATMESLARREFLAKYVGVDAAKEVNALYESKLLLKNQKAGFITWAKRVGGLTKEVRRDLISRIERLDRVLSPKEQEMFLSDLASTKLGVEVTETEAKAISELSTKLSELRGSFDVKKEEWTSQKDADMYGATQVALENYINYLKEGETSIPQMLKDRGYKFKAESEKNLTRATGKLLLDTAKTIADNSISLVATLDDSFMGRQGIMNLLSGHPIIWSKTFLSSLSDFAKTLGGKKADDALLAKIYSDPLYMNGEYKKAKIMDTREEQFPTSIPEKIPGLGRLFKASEVAFKNSSLRMRTQMYTLQRNIKTSRNIEITDEEIEGMGKVVNSLSARGHLGRAGDNSIVRLLMWAPKMLKADIDIITAHSFDDIPKSDRWTARANLAKIIIATVAINTIAGLNGKEVELDPRSSDFMKLDKKYGYLRGVPQVITLMARMITGQYKTASGEVVAYEPGFGKRSRLDALYAFLRGKAPPATGAVYDSLAGEDFQGNAPTFSSILLQRGVPISIQNLLKLRQDPSLDKTFGVIADFFGLNANINPEPNIKSKVIKEGKTVKERDLVELVTTYAEALKTDPETAWNRFFTGQEILQVSDGGIIVVKRQAIKDSQAYKAKFGDDVKKVRLDHTIPNKLGGEEKESNWKVISESLWKSYTPVETALIKAVKKDKIKLKDAQREIVKFKNIEDASERKEYGLYLRNKYK